MWFQQNGATCHTASVRMDLLRGEFREYFISRSEPVNWPPRSCVLMPFGYFLWGYVKAHVFTNNPPSIGALEDNIEAFIRKIAAEMLERVRQNWTKRRSSPVNICLKYSSNTKLY